MSIKIKNAQADLPYSYPLVKMNKSSGMVILYFTLEWGVVLVPGTTSWKVGEFAAFLQHTDSIFEDIEIIIDGK